MFTKIGFLTKKKELGFWRASILFRNASQFFFVLYLGTKLTSCVPKITSKCIDGNGKQKLALDGGKCLV